MAFSRSLPISFAPPLPLVGRFTIVALTLLCVAPPCLLAADIAVPAQQGTIQLAINVAQPGDTVVVSPGTYFELIDFLGKAITVRSVAGPTTTIIDGSGAGPVVAFQTGEGPGSVLEGFTIQNGFGGAPPASPPDDQVPGGILCDSASPTIRGNVIRDHLTYYIGAGAYCKNSNAIFDSNEFINNLSQIDPVWADIVDGEGAGLQVRGGAVTLIRNRFSGNSSQWRGGALYIFNSVGSTVSGCVFEDNSSARGGAIAIAGSSNVEITNVLFVANVAFPPQCFCPYAEGFGAAIFVEGSSTATITFATIVGNSMSQDGNGGGIYHEPTTPVQAPVIVRNSIVRGNSATSNPQLDPLVTTVTYSNVEGVISGVGNIDLDPLFTAGPFGAHYLSDGATGQPSTSPCVDAGDPNDLPPASSVTRIDHVSDTETVDMGYHSFVEAPFHRGDCNSDGQVNIADAIFLLSALFPVSGGSATPITCDDACDANDSGTLNIADPISILNALFATPAVPLPPPTGACGLDPTADVRGCTTQSGC